MELLGWSQAIHGDQSVAIRAVASRLYSCIFESGAISRIGIAMNGPILDLCSACSSQLPE